MRILIFIILLLIKIQVLAQLSGQVKDFKTGKFISEAEVFIDQSMNTALTDEDGIFHLDGLDPGTYKVGCFKSGYKTTFKTVTVDAGENLVLFILRDETAKSLNDKNLKKEVIRDVLSVDPQAGNYSIKSSELRYEEDNTGKKYFGTIEFDNLATGYKIKCHLLDFTVASPTYMLQFYPLSGKVAEQNRWDESRFLNYQSSINNFLESVLQSTSTLHGYEIYDINNNPLSVENYLSVGYSGQRNHLNINQKIKVTHTVNGTSIDSWIHAKEKITFNDLGVILNQDSVMIEGGFIESSLLNKLPIEYSPRLEKKIFKLSSYFEKAYVHTDKPYYYPGDTLWFKAYMNYSTLALIESLSKVLYVELLTNQNGGTIIDEKILKIEDGEAWGQFVIADTTSIDFIALRAYTNWQRNYGEDQVFLKYIPLVNRKYNFMNFRGDVKTNKNILLKFDKKNYSKRDNIQFSVSVLSDKKELVSAWMSVSVTDRSMVRLLNDSINITTDYEIKNTREVTKINHHLERGLGIEGHYANQRNNPTMAHLSLMLGGFEKAFEFDTDIYGKFSISGLDYMDSTTIRYMIREGQYVVSGGRLVLEKRNPLPIQLTWPSRIENTERADYKIDKNTILLEEVIIEAKKIVTKEEMKPIERVKIIRPYGEPDYILDGKGLNYSMPNVIEMMRGRIPGLTISYDGTNYTLRFNRTTTISLNTEPMVLIDDVPMGGSAEQALLILFPADIASFEVTTRLNPLFGDRGANGVISVYTKQSGLRDFNDPTEKLAALKVVGYTTPAKFGGVNHTTTFRPANSDYRTTLYWNPSAISSTLYGTDIISFYASDSTGPYMVTIEGVTSEGKPFRTEQLIELIEDEK